MIEQHHELQVKLIDRNHDGDDSYEEFYVLNLQNKYVTEMRKF